MGLACGVAGGGLFKTSTWFLLTMHTAYEFISSVWPFPNKQLAFRSSPAAILRNQNIAI